MKERRKGQRFVLKVPVTLYRINDSAVEGLTVNVSYRGVLVTLQRDVALKIGERTAFGLVMPYDDPILSSGDFLQTHCEGSVARIIDPMSYGIAIESYEALNWEGPAWRCVICTRKFTREDLLSDSDGLCRQCWLFREAFRTAVFRKGVADTLRTIQQSGKHMGARMLRYLLQGIGIPSRLPRHQR